MTTFKNIEINFYQSQTIGNCIDLGFSTEKTKEIILKMKSLNIDYLTKEELHNFI